MKKTAGMREILAMKAQARLLLERMIPVFMAHGPSGKHFKTHYLSKDRNLDHFMRIALSEFPEGGGRALHPVVLLGYRIMESIANGQPVSESDLDLLTTFLDKPREGKIRFHSADDPQPYHRNKSDKSIALTFVENLLEYMNLCARYGREHEVCEQCGALMFTGRGGKKFCSIECRKAAWSYARQKEYYAKKRKGGSNETV